jgi:ribosomal 30S subunit maturation factor RimM
MPAKRRRSSSSKISHTVYVVLQRSSVYGSREDEHEVSCVSIHTTLSGANQAAKYFFEIDEDDGAEEEDDWLSWEDLCGTRVQTNSEGMVRVIRVLDRQGEDLAWVEKQTIQDDSDEESTENEQEDELEETQIIPHKRFKVA